MSIIPDWMAEKLDRIKDFGKTVTSGYAPDAVAEKRYNICLPCEHFTIKDHGNKLLRYKGCDICKCYMPAKVLFKAAKCPKDFWPEELINGNWGDL